VFGIGGFRDYNESSGSFDASETNRIITLTPALAGQGRGNLKGNASNMATVKIKGISCNHCVMAVKKALSGIDGVQNVRVDLDTSEATFDEAKPVDRAVIADRVRKAGFDVA
jgi:copper chaperone